MKKRLSLTALFLFLLGPPQSFSAVTGLALLVNGGLLPEENHCEFYQDLDRAKRVLSSWSAIEVAPDGSAPNATTCGPNGEDVLDEYGRPVLEKKILKNALPATLKSLDGSLTSKNIDKLLPPEKPLVIYFTDHGDPSVVHLWNGDTLDTAHLGKILDQVSKKHRIIMLFDECYGGSMLEAAWKDGTPRPNVCGVASARADQQSTMIDSGVMKTADKLKGSNETFSDVFHAMLGDEQRYSTPSSTSMVFLEKYLNNKNDSSESSGSTCVETELALSKLLVAIAAPQIKQELNRYTNELTARLSEVGLPANSTLDQIAQAQDRAKNNASSISKKRMGLFDSLQVPENAFVHARMKSEMKDAYDNLETLQTQQTILHKDEASAQTYQKRIEIKQKLHDIETKIDRIQDQIETKKRLLGLAAIQGVNGFPDFVKSEGIKTKLWSPDIYSQMEQLKEDGFQNAKSLEQYERISAVFNSVRSINLMLKKQDSKAITNYMGFLTCENTAL